MNRSNMKPKVRRLSVCHPLRGCNGYDADESGPFKCEKCQCLCSEDELTYGLCEDCYNWLRFHGSKKHLAKVISDE